MRFVVSVAAVSTAALLAGCANMSIGMSVPIGRMGGVGVSVGSGGQVSGTVGVGVGGGSVSVGTSGQLPKKEEPQKEEEKKP